MWSLFAFPCSLVMLKIFYVLNGHLNVFYEVLIAHFLESSLCFYWTAAALSTWAHIYVLTGNLNVFCEVLAAHFFESSLFFYWTAATPFTWAPPPSPATSFIWAHRLKVAKSLPGAPLICVCDLSSKLQHLQTDSEWSTVMNRKNRKQIYC